MRRRKKKKRRKKKLPKSGSRLLIHAFGRLSPSFYVKAHSVPEVDSLLQRDFTGGVMSSAVCGSLGARYEVQFVLATGFSCSSSIPHWVAKYSWSNCGEGGYISVDISENTLPLFPRWHSTCFSSLRTCPQLGCHCGGHCRHGSGSCWAFSRTQAVYAVGGCRVDFSAQHSRVVTRFQRGQLLHAPLYPAVTCPSRGDVTCASAFIAMLGSFVLRWFTGVIDVFTTLPTRIGLGYLCCDGVLLEVFHAFSA